MLTKKVSKIYKENMIIVSRISQATKILAAHQTRTKISLGAKIFI
jgi:hypothetical protein